MIVDEEVAFVGGINLAYGRYDNHYGLQANADGRQGMNMYNSCIPPVSRQSSYNPMGYMSSRQGIPADNQQDERQKLSVGRLTVYSTLSITCSAISTCSHPPRQRTVPIWTRRSSPGCPGRTTKCKLKGLRFMTWCVTLCFAGTVIVTLIRIIR